MTFSMFDDGYVDNIPLITEWTPTPEQRVFNHAKKVFMAPISKCFGFKDGAYPLLDRFNLGVKIAYNGDLLREQMCHYLNYYEAFYDTQQNLLAAYAHIKYMMDHCTDEYNLDNFKNDIRTYVLTPSCLYNLDRLNKKNYALNLTFNTNNQVLAYRDKHGRLLLKISMLMKMCIPLICHYLDKNPQYLQMMTLDQFITDIYDLIFELFDVNIKSKLYETCTSIVEKNIKSNPIWSIQDIRGISDTTHALDSLTQIICNIMPKFDYSKNIIKFNHTSLKCMIDYKVTRKKYDFEYIQHQPTIRNDSDDEEDRFEDTLVKQDQSMILQTEFNYKYVMDKLEMKYGPLDPKEIEFFVKELSDENGNFIMNPIQKDLVFLHFYKYFGDPKGVLGNRDNYVKMLLILKKMLLSTNNMVILPYILTGKITRSFNKTSLKKSERIKLKNSAYYPLLQNNYRNEKIMNRIDAIISTLITLKVNFISYDEPELHGKSIPIRSELLVEEILQFILNI